MPVFNYITVCLKHSITVAVSRHNVASLCSYSLGVVSYCNSVILKDNRGRFLPQESLEFTINRVLMKIFRTVSLDVIRDCRLWFGMPDIKVSVVKRKKKFLMKYVNSTNRLCQLFSVDALSECNSYV